MTLKVRYLDIRHIQRLREEIEHIGSDSLKEQLDDYLSAESRQGEYICNILNDEAIRELEQINNNCLIWSLM